MGQVAGIMPARRTDGDLDLLGRRDEKVDALSRIRVLSADLCDR